MSAIHTETICQQNQSISPASANHCCKNHLFFFPQKQMVTHNLKQKGHMLTTTQTKQTLQAEVRFKGNSEVVRQRKKTPFCCLRQPDHHFVCYYKKTNQRKNEREKSWGEISLITELDFFKETYDFFFNILHTFIADLLYIRHCARFLAHKNKYS